jgi:signal transduction histidine kinase
MTQAARAREGEPELEGRRLEPSPEGARAPHPSMSGVSSAPRRRTVAGRLLASYLLVLVAFAVTLGWSFQALREAARDSDLLRVGYVPLQLKIGDALAGQNVFNTQLNHITAAKNPGDIKEWIEASRSLRPLTFSQVRDAAERGFPSDADPAAQAFRDEIVGEVLAIEKAVSSEDRYARLFHALDVGDHDAAERAQGELVKREAEIAQRLRGIKAKVDDKMDRLGKGAARREARSMQLLVGLALLTFLVGALTSLYAWRVLAPLSAVTDRAKAVARGDLTPREVIATKDEIGDLATTFEGMVAAIQRARSELVNAERLAAIGKMAAHVTHEIRNPLSAIGLNVELLEEEVHDKEPAQLVSAIKAEVERLSRIAEQYLSVARRPRPHLEHERIDDLLRELTAFVRPELDRANVTLRLDLDADLPEIAVDEAQLRQAFINLIRNAREAMSSGGELSIGARATGRGGVAITIDDTGPGIPDDVRASVFDPFFTTKQRGTGLGLAITRDIVEAHGGKITCDARGGGGTRFVVELPSDRAST